MELVQPMSAIGIPVMISGKHGSCHDYPSHTNRRVRSTTTDEPERGETTERSTPMHNPVPTDELSGGLGSSCGSGVVRAIKTRRATDRLTARRPTPYEVGYGNTTIFL